MASSSLTDVEGWMNEIEALEFHQWQTTDSKIGMESIYMKEMSSSHLKKIFLQQQSYYMWCNDSKPVTCCFLDIELEAKIGDGGNSSIH